MRIAAHRLKRLEVVHQAGIDARLHHAWLSLALGAIGEAFSKRTGAVVEVPVKGLGEVQTLRDVQTERMNVGDEQQQTREPLSAIDDAEFRGLLDRIGGIAAR